MLDAAASTTSLSMYRSSPREIRGHIMDCIFADPPIVPFLQGSPGTGKSSIYASICVELKLFLIDFRASTGDPTDLNGLPHFVNGHAVYAPFEEIFPLEGMKIPEGYNGWMILLDELNSASRAMIAACYKLLLERKVGNKKLHECVVLCAAGNLDTDRAITTPMGTAAQSRLVHLELDIVGHEAEWIEDVALPQGYDSRIIAYLSMHPSKLMDFRPDHTNKTFCCPRTWDFMSRFIKGQDVPDRKIALYAGTITAGTAVDFVQFTKVYENLINVSEIIRNPVDCRMPGDVSEKWATITHMMEKVEDSNLAAFATYANRFSLDFRILFFRAVRIRHPKMIKHESFRAALLELSRYLYTDQPLAA